MKSKHLMILLIPVVLLLLVLLLQSNSGECYKNPNEPITELKKLQSSISKYTCLAPKNNLLVAYNSIKAKLGKFPKVNKDAKVQKALKDTEEMLKNINNLPKCVGNKLGRKDTCKQDQITVLGTDDNRYCLQKAIVNPMEAKVNNLIKLYTSTNCISPSQAYEYVKTIKDTSVPQALKDKLTVAYKSINGACELKPKENYRENYTLTTDQLPLRHNSVCWNMDDGLWVFGGYMPDDMSVASQDMWVYKNDKWNKVNIEGVMPSARCRSYSFVDTDSKVMYMVGGYERGYNSGYIQDVWKFSHRTGTWEQLATSQENSPNVSYKIIMTSRPLIKQRYLWVTDGDGLCLFDIVTKSWSKYANNNIKMIRLEGYDVWPELEADERAKYIALFNEWLDKDGNVYIYTGRCGFIQELGYWGLKQIHKFNMDTFTFTFEDITGEQCASYPIAWNRTNLVWNNGMDYNPNMILLDQNSDLIAYNYDIDNRVWNKAELPVTVREILMDWTGLTRYHVWVIGNQLYIQGFTYGEIEDTGPTPLLVYTLNL